MHFRLQSKKQKNLLEIFLFCISILIFTLVNWLYFCKPTLHKASFASHYYILKKNQLEKLTAYSHKSDQAATALIQLKKIHPKFYYAALPIININQLLLILTRLVQHAQFSIIKIIPHTSSAKTNELTSVSFTATGNFSSLFSLLHTLNTYPITFPLSALSIDAHTIKMTFILRNPHAQTL